jgi:hypothetical protein
MLAAIVLGFGILRDEFFFHSDILSLAQFYAGSALWLAGSVGVCGVGSALVIRTALPRFWRLCQSQVSLFCDRLLVALVITGLEVSSIGV